MNTQHTYKIGDVATLTCPVVDSAGVARDPVTLTLSVFAPGASSATVYTFGTDAILVKDSVGNYHADLPLTASGTWFYRWTGTGTVVPFASSDLELYVEKRKF